MKSYYQVYQHSYNSYPISPAVMIYVDASVAQNENEAVSLAYDFIFSSEGFGDDPISLGVAKDVREELLSTKDEVVYYIDHYKVRNYLKTLKTK